jgi:hypothetical protein
MLSRLIEPQVKQAVNYTMLEFNHNERCPTDADWTSASAVSAFLKPFKVATKAMEGELYPTIGCVSFFIASLIEGMKAAFPTPLWETLPKAQWPHQDPAVVELRKMILNDMESRWDTNNPLLVMGSLLHPGLYMCYRYLSFHCARTVSLLSLTFCYRLYMSSP